MRLEKVLADERASAGPVGAGIGPIAEIATEPPATSTDGTAGASVTIILSCFADADTKPSERAVGFTDGVESTRTQRAQGSAAKRDAIKGNL